MLHKSLQSASSKHLFLEEKLKNMRQMSLLNILLYTPLCFSALRIELSLKF